MPPGKAMEMPASTCRVWPVIQRDSSLAKNTEIEFARNGERYAFLRWGQSAFNNFKVVPPNTGIVHQVNLEYLGRVVFANEDGVRPQAYPDTLVGTDSHTTMINGLGVLGWGVGGIEAEAAMLGQPLYMVMPEVIGMRLTGHLREGVTALLSLESDFEVVGHAGSVPEAIAKAPSLNPELVITDVLMPGMDGFQFIRQLREDGREVPVLCGEFLPAGPKGRWTPFATVRTSPRSSHITCSAPHPTSVPSSSATRMSRSGSSPSPRRISVAKSSSVGT